MGYVPGLTNDVFLSYAHGDNETDWVSSFDQGLRHKLRELLGQPPAVWRDERKFGGVEDFKEEIKTALHEAAVLICVVSPSYLQSEFCRLERRTFLEHLKSQGGQKAGNKFRYIKVVKMADADNLYRQVFSEALGFEFMEATADTDELRPFVPGAREFDDRLYKVARGVAEILGEMRRRRQSVYLAEPASDVATEWKETRRELERSGYSVMPNARLDPTYGREALVAGIKPALLSIHLMGTSYDEFAADQVKAVQELNKPMVVWVAADGAKHAEPRQQELLKTLEQSAEIFVNRTAIYELPQLIVERLQQRSSVKPEARGANGKPGVYLICDRTDPEETEYAWELRKEMIKRENLDVFLPETGLAHQALYDEHTNRLRSCDGVMLYWDRAPERWFQQNFFDVVSAPRLVRQKPFRSEAFLVKNAGAIPQGFNGRSVLIPKTPQQTVEELGGFFTGLRAGLPGGAG